MRKAPKRGRLVHEVGDKIPPPPGPRARQMTVPELMLEELSGMAEPYEFSPPELVDTLVFGIDSQAVGPVAPMGGTLTPGPSSPRARAC